MKISKRIIRIINFQSFISDLFFRICLFTFAFLLLTSCETTEPPPSDQKLTLAAEDASCTEAWLNLKIENISLPTEVELKQDDSTVSSSVINSSDTTIFIENLLPSQTYTFQTIIQSTKQKSNSVSVTTMDTTSHNFTWETFAFGGGSSSYLKDVAIINENNIWAVGEIHTAETDQFDSNGVWVQPYNAVHWDGTSWELKRILYENNFWTINTILAFSENDIWFDVFVHWNGISFSNETIPNILMGWRSNALWGISSKDLFVVGNGGNIAHYNGSNWRKIESGAELNIYDIYGDFNPKTNSYEIVAVAADLLSNSGRAILKIENGKVTHNNSESITQPLQSLWFKSNRKYYIVGSGIYVKNSLNEDSWKRLSRDISIYFKNSIVAQEINDIIITGAFNEVLHYNGISWKSYRGNELPDINGRLLNADYKNNLVCIVGQYENKGKIYIGRK